VYNKVVVTSTGKVVVLTNELDTDSGQLLGSYFTTSMDSGQTWSAPLQVIPMTWVIGGNSPKIAIDPNDRIYVLFAAKLPAGLFVSKYDSNLNLLIDTVQIAPSFQYTHWTPHITVDAQGRLHVIWHEGDHKKGEQSEVYYCRA